MLDIFQIFKKPEKYINEAHSKKLDLPIGTTVTAIIEGIASFFSKKITVEIKPPTSKKPSRKKFLKKDFLELPEEHRSPLNPQKLPKQNESDAIIDEIHFRLSHERATQIRNAIFAALNEHTNAQIPKNPFRVDDNEEAAFQVVVAAEQECGAYNPATPPRFMSVTRDRNSYKDSQTGKFNLELLTSTADETYCATIRKAVRVLMAGTPLITTVQAQAPDIQEPKDDKKDEDPKWNSFR